MPRGKPYSSEFKAKVVIESLREDQTLNELAAKYNITSKLISNWRSQFLGSCKSVFESTAEATRAQLDQAKGEANKAKKLSLDLEQAQAELAKQKDLSLAEKKALEQKLAEQQLAVEKFKATTVQEDSQLEDRLKKELADKDVQISRLKDQLKVTVASEILFPSGSAELSPEGVDVLRKVANAANKAQDEVRVEGHTDTDPIASVLAQYYPTNWELSTARAAVAVRTLEATGMVIS